MMASWYGCDARGGMSPATDVSARRHFILLKAPEIAAFARCLRRAAV
jgi:hypothetical protein